MDMHRPWLSAGTDFAGVFDPEPFLSRLEAVLTGDSAAGTLIAQVVALLETVDAIEACRILRPDAGGQIAAPGALDRFDPEHRHINASSDAIPKDDGDSPWALAWRSGRPEIIDDWPADPRAAMWRESARPLNVQSAAAVPLRGRAGPHSLLMIYSNARSFFSTVWNREVLAKLASSIGNALENQENHAALQRVDSLYRTLFNSAGILLTAGSETLMLKRLCRTLVQSGLFVAACIATMDGHAVLRHIEAAARRNVRALRMAAYQHRPGRPRQGFLPDAWDANKTLIANAYFGNPRYAPEFPLAIKLGFESMAGLIIRRGGRRWAVLSVSAGTENFFDAKLIELLEQLAGIAGHALDEIDLKAKLRAEREAQSRMARQDPLTGLPNRLRFEEQLAGAMARARRHGRMLGIGMIDLDDFKRINDNWGHQAGDVVLRTIACRLRAMLREVDFVARLGGDEFALILEDWTEESKIDDFCARLFEAVHAPVRLAGGQVLRLAPSAGFTLHPPDDAAPDLLVRHADIALYAAKAEKGRSSMFWRVYEDMAGVAAERFHSRHLLQTGGLEVHYQPIVTLQDRQIVGVEALARLNDGERLIQPAKFLHELLLDDRDLLFRQVLETGLDQLQLWDEMGFRLNLSVNVDAEILLQEKTLPYLRGVLARRPLEARRLILEILETHDFLDVTRANSQISAVRALGVRVALDDLGVGYLSILKIRELPLDMVKLDRAFVAGIYQRPDDMMFVSVLRTLTQYLGMELVVEGVEHQDVLHALQILGVRKAQGYAIAPPRPAPALANWLKHYEPKPAAAEPASLLSAYACHLNWTRALLFARVSMTLTDRLNDEKRVILKNYFAGPGARYGRARKAHEALQALAARPDSATADIIAAAADFRHEMMAALRRLYKNDPPKCGEAEFAAGATHVSAIV